MNIDFGIYTYKSAWIDVVGDNFDEFSYLKLYSIDTQFVPFAGWRRPLVRLFLNVGCGDSCNINCYRIDKSSIKSGVEKI